MQARDTSYNTMDGAAQDTAWSADALEASNGFLALEDTYTRSVSLPESQRWPWSDSKGVYILASSYELHCVVCYFYIHHRHCVFIVVKINVGEANMDLFLACTSSNRQASLRQE